MSKKIVIKKEAQVEKYLVRQCMRRKYHCWKLTSPNRKGVPDRLVLAHEGVAVLVELKKPGGKLSALQGHTIARLREMRHAMFVCENFDEVDAVMGIIEDVVAKREGVPSEVQS